MDHGRDGQSSCPESAAQISGDYGGIVRKVMAYIAPKLIGGREAKGPVGGQGYPDPQESLFLKPGKISRLGDDYLIESEVDGNVHRNC